MEFPGDVGLVLGRLQAGLVGRRDLVGVYVYGSLVTGDFSPARSDIDVVVMLDREPDEAAVRELRRLHAEVAGSGGAAGQLHCLYVAAGHASDPERLCPYWFGDRMTQWQMKVMTQAELADRIRVSYVRLNEIVNGRRGITPSTALRLAKAFSTSPQFWLNGQLALDLYRASHDAEELRQLARIVTVSR